MLLLQAAPAGVSSLFAVAAAVSMWPAMLLFLSLCCSSSSKCSSAGLHSRGRTAFPRPRRRYHLRPQPQQQQQQQGSSRPLLQQRKP